MTDNPKNKPGKLFLQGGEPFHENAGDEFNNRVRQFKDRLEENTISQYKQDRSDNVSARHVTSAYDHLVPPTQKVVRSRAINNVVLGMSSSAFIAVLASMWSAQGPPSALQLASLLVLFLVGAYATFGFAKTLR